MEKITKILVAFVVALCGVLLLTKGASYAKYASNSAWNYYLESKDFYLSSDYLSPNGMKNVNNNWDLSNIHFNVRNSHNDILATEYDINYKVTCTTNNENVLCNLNDTGKNEYNGVLSATKKCVNEINEVDVSRLSESECEVNGYEWKSIVATKDLHFNLTSETEFDNVIVNINVTSTHPYKKTLLGTFELTKDKSINGVVLSQYNNYDEYDRLIISNSYFNEKCVKVSYDSNVLRVDTPLVNVDSFEQDANGFINSVIFKVPSKESRTFKFYKVDSTIHGIEDFTIIESDC